MKKVVATILALNSVFMLGFSASAIEYPQANLENPSKVNVSQSLDAPSLFSADGWVLKDGVRLRSRPSTSSKVLYLMYKDDIILDQSSCGSGESCGRVYADGHYWIYIYHQKSQLYGWVAEELVQF